MSIRHMMMIKYHRDITGEQKEALVVGLAKMPEVMDFIRRYEFGADLGLSDETYDFGLVADFDSENDWRRYSQNPDHQIVLHNLVRPVAEELVRVQYEVG